MTHRGESRASEADPSPAEPADVVGLEYARKLYASITGWYTDTHGRAQIILTVDGAFITLLAGVVVAKEADLRPTLSVFGVETWISLAVMALGFAISTASALSALIPLRLSPKRIRADYDELARSDEQHHRDPPSSVMWYSQFIIQMGQEDFISRVSRMSDDHERDALAQEVYLLSRRLRRKYRALFVAYLGTGVAVLALLFAASDYVVLL
jgi:hypothetical protein